MSSPWRCSQCRGEFDTWDQFDLHRCAPKPRRRWLALAALLALPLAGCTQLQIDALNRGEMHTAVQNVADGNPEALVFCTSSDDPSRSVILQWLPSRVLAMANCWDSETIGANNVMVQWVDFPPPTTSFQVP